MKIFLFLFFSFLVLTSAQNTCQTPDRENGYCLPYKKCQNYFNYLQSKYSGDALKEFLKKSRCNDDPNISLCCDEFYLTADSFTGTSEYIKTLNSQGLQMLSSITKCGDVSNRRIAFGEEATLSEFPWMALIEYNVTKRRYLCGGSLITKRFVLTAAHCLVGVPDIVGVLLGEHNLDTEPDCQQRGPRKICAPPSEKYGIDKIIPHPNYRKSYIGYDIGLIKLKRDVDFKNHIRPVCLPITPFTIKRHERYLIAGWGTTETGTPSRILKKASVPYQEREVCSTIFRRLTITSHHLCVGGGSPIDSCKGDSGGPLFISTTYLPTKSRYVQYGIVSFGGTSCSTLEKYPAIYTNITEFMPWITNTIIL